VTSDFFLFRSSPRRRGHALSKARAAPGRPLLRRHSVHNLYGAKATGIRGTLDVFWGNRTSRGVEGRDTLETDDAMVMFFSLNSIVQRAVEREPSSLPLNLFGKQKKPNSNPNNDNKNSDTSRVVLRVLTARSVQRVLAQVRKLEREKEREETEEKEPLLGLSLSLSLSLSLTLSLFRSL